MLKIQAGLWLGIGLGVAGSFSYFQDHPKFFVQDEDPITITKVVEKPVPVQRTVIIEKQVFVPTSKSNEFICKEGEFPVEEPEFPHWPHSPLKERAKNKLVVFGAVGFDNYNDAKNSDASKKFERGVIGGLGYEREFTDRMAVGAFGFSNGTYGVSVGWRF